MNAVGCGPDAATLVVAVGAQTLGVNFALHGALGAYFCLENFELGFGLVLMRSLFFKVLMYLLIRSLTVCLVLLIEVLTC